MPLELEPHALDSTETTTSFNISYRRKTGRVAIATLSFITAFCGSPHVQAVFSLRRYLSGRIRPARLLQNLPSYVTIPSRRIRLFLSSGSVMLMIALNFLGSAFSIPSPNRLSCLRAFLRNRLCAFSVSVLCASI